MDVSMNPGSRGELSSQESELLSDNELIAITKEIPLGMLDDIGLIMENENVDDYKIIGMDPTQPQPVNHNLDAVTQSPTCQLPCTDEWLGNYNFELLVDGNSSSKKTWLFSIDLNKIYVDVNQSIPIQFKLDRGFENEMLFVRVVAIYNVTQHLHVPVKRCPNHLKEDEDRGLQNIEHVVQCRDERAVYEYDNVSKRYSVVVPLEYPPAGSDVTTLMYSVTCKGSCAGGMNRRPVTLIFTLERMYQQVVGRRTLNIRVCSCPKRDKKKEEAEKREVIGTQMVEPDIKKNKILKSKHQTSSTLEQPLPKKRKSLFTSSCDNDTQIYNIQVTGTKYYIEMLQHIIRLTTCEWVKTRSLEAWQMKEEYEEMLEKASKGSSS